MKLKPIMKTYDAAWAEGKAKGEALGRYDIKYHAEVAEAVRVLEREEKKLYDEGLRALNNFLAQQIAELQRIHGITETTPTKSLRDIEEVL